MGDDCLLIELYAALFGFRVCLEHEPVQHQKATDLIARLEDRLGLTRSLELPDA